MGNRELKAERLRRIIAVIAIAVTIYYLFWRVTETLNPNALVFSWALWIAELFGFITTALFYFTVWRPLRRAAPPPLEGRTVDVFIPTVSEPLTVLRKTLLACKKLTYPHRTVVLDDGNRKEVKELCDELGCTYIARPSHDDAKAGNVNYGLQLSNAEFIAIFDADHAPLPRFIDRLIGYFKDDEVAFVQSPQAFYNIDSFMHRVDEQKKYVWGEQGLFYDLIQPGRDRWNAAYFVGSCALMRRKALDDIGGFATGSITEDMMTSIRLQAEGWSSVYHNETLAYGIAAETILPFHIQRRRWGLGGWQVFFKANPLFVRGLSFQQRLCYLASLIYPIEGFQKFVFYITPPIALFTGILPMRALDIYYLLHFVPYYVISLFAFNEMGRGFGGNLMLEQFSMGKFITYIRSFFALLLPKRARQFKVTPKADSTQAPYSLLAPQLIVFIVSITAIVWALVQLILQFRNDEFIIAVNSLWALYNSGLGLAIFLYAKKKIVQRRESFRIPDAVPVLYRYRNGAKDVLRLSVAEDLTRKGLSLLSIDRIPEGQELTMKIVLPATNIVVKGILVQGKSAAANGHTVSRAGFALTEIAKDDQDTLVRYLHESAVSKFLGEYATRYKTYLEKRFERARKHQERAERIEGFLPVVVMNGNGNPSYGVMRNVSASGFLLLSRQALEPGKRVSLQVVIGKELVPLEGVVARTVDYESRHFPEMLAGVKLTRADHEAVLHILRIGKRIESIK
jgi:cellulose synthase (UDP-forming)